jgi:hypothetical protein
MTLNLPKEIEHQVMEAINEFQNVQVQRKMNNPEAI